MTSSRTVIVGSTTMATTGLPKERVYSAPITAKSPVQTNRRHIVREPGHMLRDWHKF